MAERESSIREFETVISLAHNLTGKTLILYSCRFDFLAFGSWAIEAGTPHRRLQIVRDGRDGVLRCSTASLQNASAVPIWRQHKVIAIDRGASFLDLEVWIDTVLREFGVQPPGSDVST